MFFSLALHPALHALQAAVGQEVFVLAYLDDVFLLVPHGQVQGCLLHAKDIFEKDVQPPNETGKVPGLRPSSREAARGGI